MSGMSTGGPSGQSHVASVFGPIIARKFTSSIVDFCTVEFRRRSDAMHTGPAGIVYKHFEKVTAPRVYRGPTHDLHEMIFMALTTTWGPNGWADVERFVDAR